MSENKYDPKNVSITFRGEKVTGFSGEMVPVIAKRDLDSHICQLSSEKACSVFARYVSVLNDHCTAEQRIQLRPYLLLSASALATPKVETKRALKAVDWIFRVHRPIWLTAAGLPDLAAQMRVLPEIVDEATLSAAASLQKTVIEQVRDPCAPWSTFTSGWSWASWDARAARAAWGDWGAWATDWDARVAWDIVTRIAVLAGNPTATAFDSVRDNVQRAELELLECMLAIDC